MQRPQEEGSHGYKTTQPKPSRPRNICLRAAVMLCKTNLDHGIKIQIIDSCFSIVLPWSSSGVALWARGQGQVRFVFAPGFTLYWAHVQKVDSAGTMAGQRGESAPGHLTASARTENEGPKTVSDATWACSSLQGSQAFGLPGGPEVSRWVETAVTAVPLKMQSLCFRERALG